MKIAKQLVLALGIVSLAACGGGGGSGSGESGATAPISNDVENVSTNTGTNPDTSSPDTTNTSGTGSSDGTSTTTTDETTSGAPTTAPSAAPANNDVSLTWDIPAAREDGSYLAVYEIDGYELRYSKDNSNTETVVRIEDAQTTDWVLEDAEPGYYEFTIATIDSDGVYSQYSTPASKTIE